MLEGNTNVKCKTNVVDEFINFMNSNVIFADKETKKYPKDKTHTIIFNKPFDNSSRFKGGTFSIAGKNYDKFMKLYKRTYGKLSIPLVERHNEDGKKVGPMIIDIDYKNTSQKRSNLMNNMIKL